MFTLQAPAHWSCIEFVSDLHLSEATPLTTRTFLRYLQRSQADAVLLLGDIFEVWVGDDVLAEPGLQRTVAHALTAASNQRLLGFMVGNRDFLVGAAARTQMGLQELPDPTILRAWGETTVLTHGDAWCLADLDYQRFRAEVRTAAWQQAFLSQSLAKRQTIARGLRDLSEARKHSAGPMAYGDIDAATAVQHLLAAHSRRLIHGHTHRPSDDKWPLEDPASATGEAPVAQRHVLSDWDCDDAQAPRAQILRLTPTGLTRLEIGADGSAHGRLESAPNATSAPTP